MQFAGWIWFLPLAGLLAGVVMGYAARRQHFCTMSSLERHWYAGDGTGVRTWALAALSALVSTQALAAAGLFDPADTLYLRPTLALGGTIAGGIAFGVGMALVGTCGFGALVRLGGGSLRALVVLIVLGLTAVAAQRGFISGLRGWFETNLVIDLGAAGDQSLGTLATTILGFDAHWVVMSAVAAAMAMWIFSDADYRGRFASIGAGVVIGIVVAFGWFATSIVSATSFELVRIESASFVAPVGDTLLRFAISFGTPLTYGMGLTVGVVAGAALCAIRSRDVRWEACDDARELGRHIAGGLLMGTGGVLALGCTIGQGVSAVSVLALSAPIAMASILLGARLGLAYLIEGSPLGAFRR